MNISSIFFWILAFCAIKLVFFPYRYTKYWRRSRIVNINNIKPWESPNQADFWDGPTPTAAQRARNLQFIENHLQQFPESSLKEKYPTLVRKNQVEQLLQILDYNFRAGRVTPAQYLRISDEILSWIDISEDLPQNIHTNEKKD